VGEQQRSEAKTQVPTVPDAFREENVPDTFGPC